ncbi:MAG: bifunctional hydroxymethylpyrimidine kinase/phosphomethylpyrimidine kinase, partial [Acidimicrobiia bacterium]
MGSPEVLSDVPRALTIAGSDSGGGAGIQADLKTFLALGVHGMSAIVALTAQNTTGVSAIHEVPSAFVHEQIKQVVTDIGVDAAKTGMLANGEIVTTVAEAVSEFSIPNLVVDPVFVSKSRDVLLATEAVDALTNKLFPLATVITPNLYETSALLDREVVALEDMREAAKKLHEFGPKFVLVKGGHLEGEATDVLYDGDSIVEIPGEPFDSPHKHGTGCTLAAATAAFLARGETVLDSVVKAKEFVTGAIRYGLAIGKGYGPVNPGWNSTLLPVSKL